MILSLARRPSDAVCTIGDLFIGGVHELFTLEDVVREVPGAPVVDWKVPGKTAIPAGRYRITLEDSHRFGPDTITLNNVPGFTSIRMHAGNTADDTEGCIIVGDRVMTDRIAGGTADHVLEKLKDHVIAALQYDGECWIEIENAP